MASAAILETLPIIERRTLGDSAYLHLRELLMSGRVGPGERLSLRNLAEALGVSMMPVREAVTRLVADRALEVTPNRAVRVPVLTVTQFRGVDGDPRRDRGFRGGAARPRQAAPESVEAIAAAEKAFRTEGRKTAPRFAARGRAQQGFSFRRL